jgi:hypothetical protein
MFAALCLSSRGMTVEGFLVGAGIIAVILLLAGIAHYVNTRKAARETENSGSAGRRDSRREVPAG